MTLLRCSKSDPKTGVTLIYRAGNNGSAYLPTVEIFFYQTQGHYFFGHGYHSKHMESVTANWFLFSIKTFKSATGLCYPSFNNSNDQRLILVHETMCVCVSKMTVNVDV